MSRKLNLVGKKFGRLTVIELALPHKCSGHYYTVYLCKCDCGKYTKVKAAKLKSGRTKSCGCLRSLKSKQKVIDLTGQTFGYLTVIKRVLNKISKCGCSKVQWECLCQCVKTTYVTSGDLKASLFISCGCMKHKTIALKNYIDLTNKRFGKLVALKRYSEDSTGSKSNRTKWLCRCDCGNTIYVRTSSLTTGNTLSCGCLLSKSLSIISNYLRSNDINFKSQYNFEDLIGPNGGRLRYDFGILDLNDNLLFLLLYNGQQHYKECGLFFGRYQRLITDNLKTLYAKNHNIKIYYISYNEDILLSLNKIFKDNTVPSQAVA